jgi:hypothetical protein
VDEENYVISIIEQVRDVAKLADKKPSIVYIYTADQWKKKAFEIVLKEREKSMKEIGGFENKKEAGEVLQKFIKNRIWEKNLRTIDEEKVLEKAKATLKGELEADIQINSRRDPLEKKAKSMPLRPAVYIE